MIFAWILVWLACDTPRLETWNVWLLTLLLIALLD